MERLCLFLLMAILSNVAFGLSYRYKRQSTDLEGDLEDWYRPTQPTQNDYAYVYYPGKGFFLVPIAPGQLKPTSTPNTTPSSQSNVEACQRTCKVTSEYNPVCGTDNRDYDNPSRLFCAQACGVNVQLLRQSRCPPPSTATS